MAKRKETKRVVMQQLMLRAASKYAARGYTVLRYDVDSVSMRKSSRCGKGVYNIAVDVRGRIRWKRKTNLSPLTITDYTTVRGRFVRVAWINTQASNG